MSTFYLELAIRVLRLANALQYENAINLLRLALSAEGEVDHAPEALRSIDVDLQFCGGFFAAPFVCWHQRPLIQFRWTTKTGAARGCTSAGSYGSGGVS